MPILDFKEIPEAHKATGEQDTFELFARDFLEMRGFRILTPPGRGADGGKDMIVEETRIGIAGETSVKWLVSCKHKAHSGSSVGTEIETNIRDRVESNRCQGFIGFYATLPSSSLVQSLENLSRNTGISHLTYDSAKIERELLDSSDGIKLAERFFPTSTSLWKRNNPTPVKLFSDNKGLKCANCGADLLSKEKYTAVVVYWERIDSLSDIDEKYVDKYQDIYWCCKGDCDRALKFQYRRRNPNWVDSWSDISDLCIPHVYLQLALSTIRSLQAGKAIYTDKALEKLLGLLFELYPFITRELTDNEEEELQNLREIPSYLGGMGE